ncbi:MAG TPA: hypothetical protein VF810_02880 [Patescibacteria group bacterium]
MDNQIKNKEIENFVRREIYANQSVLIDAVINKRIFTSLDIINLYREFDANLLFPNKCVKCQLEFDCLDSQTGECESCFERNMLPRQIFEWWLVSPWLGKKLLMEGEPVIDNGFGIWWGRATTGQAISLDYIIGKIYDDVRGYIK